MNTSPDNKPSADKEALEKQRQREQEQGHDQVKRDQAGKKPGFDKDQVPPKAGVPDVSQLS